MPVSFYTATSPYSITAGRVGQGASEARGEPAAPEVRLHKLAVMLVSGSQRASDAGARRSFGSYGAMKPRGAVMR